MLSSMTTGPPRRLWAGVALVALLRALPWMATFGGSASGSVLPPVGYNPKDWLAYVAFIRDAAAGHFFLTNPFTTAPQDGRYVLLFHAVLGRVVAWTGVDAFTVLELARVPLLALFLVVLWRVTGVVLSERRERVLACWLVLFSGGFEVLVDALQSRLPPQVQWQVGQDLWHLQGWNTFAACYNPLWVAALALTLFTLVPLVRPGGPSGLADAATLGGGLLLLAFSHPYSVFVILAVAAARPALAWVFRAGPGGLATVLGGLAPALAVVALVSRWQSADEVYRATSGNALGPQALSASWYPVTLGAVLLFALRGWQGWLVEKHPARLGLAAWTLAVAFLHGSTVLNGYHFVLYLHVPVCLAAAPALARTLDGLRERRLGRLGTLALGAALFQAPFSLTWKCIREARGEIVQAGGMEIVQALADLPPGNVLAPADIGNLVPAHGPHRVYVGQWFLTPDFERRAEQALAAVRGELPFEDLVRLVEGERIRYLVTSVRVAPQLAALLGKRVSATKPAGELVVLVLEGVS
jgi:hypothetical protein